jgi:hypothetical protein
MATSRVPVERNVVQAFIPRGSQPGFFGGGGRGEAGGRGAGRRLGDFQAIVRLHEASHCACEARDIRQTRVQAHADVSWHFDLETRNEKCMGSATGRERVRERGRDRGREREREGRDGESAPAKENTDSERMGVEGDRERVKLYKDRLRKGERERGRERRDKMTTREREKR